MEREVPAEPEARSRPTLPELARTAIARAAAATVSHVGPGKSPAALGPVPVRSDPAGSLVLLAPADSALEQQLELAARPGAVIVSVPATAPYSALTLTGAVRPLAHDRAAGITAHSLTVQSVEFAGAVPAPVPLADYRAAAPDPLWREAPGMLRHLEHGHMSDLVGCIRAHGLPLADWVIPRGLDRYGLELIVLMPAGVETIRLSFPGGPVTSLDEAPSSIRVALTCRCQSSPNHLPGA